MSTDLATQDPDTDDLATYRETTETGAPDYGRMSAYDLVQIAQLHAMGRSQRQIAAAIGCSQPAVCYALRRMNIGTDAVKAIMRASVPDMVDTWKAKAKQTNDHRAAREFIEAAHPELRPQPATNGAGGGVTINIGMPGQPIGLPTIEVVASAGEGRNVSVTRAEATHLETTAGASRMLTDGESQ